LVGSSSALTGIVGHEKRGTIDERPSHQDHRGESIGRWYRRPFGSSSSEHTDHQIRIDRGTGALSSACAFARTVDTKVQWTTFFQASEAWHLSVQPRVNA
jgi:hypothetical protein